MVLMATNTLNRNFLSLAENMRQCLGGEKPYIV